jgi:hypothetical protein
LRVWEDAVVGFAFISYSSTDRWYVELLVAELSRRHLDFWYDRRIDSGDRWTQAIESKVRGCAAFVPVVTPDSVASEWCERELHLADRLGKPMAPLLLDGVVPIILITRQYADVSDGVLPPPRWFETVAVHLAAEGGELPPIMETRVASGRSTVQPTTDAPRPTSGERTEQTGAGEVSSSPLPPPAPAPPSPDAAVSRQSALVGAVQHPSTLVSATILGVALIYFLVLSPELGMRTQSGAAVVLGAVALAISLGLHYKRGVARERRLDEDGGRHEVDAPHRQRP